MGKTDFETSDAPNTKESEMMVLGCMLTHTNALDTAASCLETSDFYYAEHQMVYSTLKAFHAQEKPADIHLVGEELKRQGKLEGVGGIRYLIMLAQFAGTSAFIEEYVGLLREKSILRQMLSIGEKIRREVIEEPSDITAFLEGIKGDISVAERSLRFSQIPLMSIEKRLKLLDEKLEKSRGQAYLGLCQKTIPDIDTNLLGLRKLLLLAAAPNVGKTAFTIQLAVDVLKNHPEACLVYFSLEMQESEIFTRMFCNLAQMDYRTFVLGSGAHNKMIDPSARFTEKEIEAIERAQKVVGAIGDRLQIIDGSRTGNLNAPKAISFINELKERTRTSRVIVIIDYLQVWPLPQNLRFSSEIEADKWRVGEMKKIRDAIDEDPIIVISEARKPSGSDSEWGNDLSSVMGSARATYTPDGVMLFSQINPKELSTLATGSKASDESVTKKIISALACEKMSICRLDFLKGRDGMQRFTTFVKFYYGCNLFKPTTIDGLKMDLKLIK